MASAESGDVILGTGQPASSPGLGAGDYLSVGGDLLSGLGQLEQGLEIQDADNYNAQILSSQAEQSLVAGNIETAKIGVAEEELLGTQKAMYAKAGVTTFGSPTDVALNTASNFEYDKQIATYNANVQAQNLNSQAGLEKMYGAEAANKGIMSLGASLLKGAGALL